MIIHISGTPGSGKTTLGEKLQEIYSDKIVVYDTDEFIQHHNEAGKILLNLEKTSTIEEYMKTWNKLLHDEIEKFVETHKNKIIVFTGILDNFSADGTIYKINADHKFMLNVPLNEILKRYYTRICNDDKNKTKDQSDDYWNKVADETYNINSSKEKIESYKKDIKWHTENGYQLKTDEEIIKEVENIIKNSKGGYYEKYYKYKHKYLKLKSV